MHPFELYSGAVGITSTAAVLLSAVLSDGVKDRVRNSMFGNDDLEFSSSEAAEAIVEDITSNDQGNFSFTRFVVIYAVSNAAVFTLLRVFNPDCQFQIDGENRLDLIVLAVVIGAIWYSLSFLESRVFLSVIRRVPESWRLLFVVIDLIATHLIVIFCISVFSLTNLGISQLLHVNADGGWNAIFQYSKGLISIENGIDQIVFAQYLSAYTVTIILWLQLFMTMAARFLLRRPTDSSDDGNKQQKRSIRLVPPFIQSWIKPTADPFMVWALILILIETVAFVLHWSFTILI